MTIGRGLLLYVLLLVVSLVGLLAIDSNYFDMPLGRAEAGLMAPQAPPPPFATAVTFDASRGDAIEVSLAAKDGPVQVTMETLSPGGEIIFQGKATLADPKSGTQRPQWQSFLVPAPAEGQYTLRLTQDAPGRITVYFFQGPFLIRIIGLPFAIALVLFLIYKLGPTRRSATGRPLPEPGPIVQSD